MTNEEVIDFLNDLAVRAKPAAQKDYQELLQFAKDSLNITEPQAWDLSYASEKLKQEKYAFSNLEVKAYFPANKVIQGLFHQIHHLYQIQEHLAQIFAIDDNLAVQQGQDIMGPNVAILVM